MYRYFLKYCSRVYVASAYPGVVLYFTLPPILLTLFALWVFLYAPPYDPPEGPAHHVCVVDAIKMLRDAVPEDYRHWVVVPSQSIQQMGVDICRIGGLCVAPLVAIFTLVLFFRWFVGKNPHDSYLENPSPKLLLLAVLFLFLVTPLEAAAGIVVTLPLWFVVHPCAIGYPAFALPGIFVHLGLILYLLPSKNEAPTTVHVRGPRFNDFRTAKQKQVRHFGK